MSEAALQLVEPEVSIEKPSALFRRATEVASVCKAVVVSTAVDIQGKKYIPVEGWATIAAAYACAPSIREVIEEDRGIRAVAELRRADGSVVATAEGFCGLDEPTWSNRPLYARRGMAQTRAISRVCRTAFAFVVTLMDAGLETTPAEEMPRGKQVAADVVDAEPVVSSAGDAHKCSQATRVRFGKSKGKCLHEIDAKDLDWQLGAARKSMEADDPKWGAQNKAWFLTVQAEVERRAH